MRKQRPRRRVALVGALCTTSLLLILIFLIRRGSVTRSGPDTHALSIGDSCSIYVLDPARDLGLPACNWTDSRVWPFAHNGNKLQASGPLQHWEQQHSVNYWVARAVADAGVAASDPHSADLVLVNSHCYEEWRLGARFVHQKLNQTSDWEAPDRHMRTMMQHLHTWPQWRSSNGSRFVTTFFWPQTPPATVRLLRPCNASTTTLVATHSQFCEKNPAKHLRQGLILPFVSLPSLAHMFSWGKLQRRAVVDGLNHLARPDADLSCACDICPGALDHDKTMARMRRSVFCAALAGDAQTSRRLVESVLSGCIPVFVGPGWHTLPLADDIDYAAFSVFFRVTNATWIVTDPAKATPLNGPALESTWYADSAVAAAAATTVDDVAGIDAVLRAMTSDQIAAKQAALAKVMPRFSYRRAPGATLSGAGELIVRRLCDRAARVRTAA